VACNLPVLRQRGRSFVFDLNRDQNESYNVSAHFPGKEAAMREKLEAKRQEMKANPRGWKKK
jgi:hypothetical protein